MNSPSSSSYIELCIQALPPAKQAKAREVFHDLLEGRDDDSMLARLLIVFEATAAYGRTIPQEMAEVMERQMRALDERLAQAGAHTLGTDEQRLDQMAYIFRTQFPMMVKGLAPDKLVGAIESLRVSVDRLERSSRRQRRVRLAVVLAFMALALGAGVGGTMWWFYQDYTRGQASLQNYAVLNRYGVGLKLTDGGNRALRITLNGRTPLYDRTWLVDGTNQCVGVEVKVPPSL